MNDFPLPRVLQRKRKAAAHAPGLSDWPCRRMCLIHQGNTLSYAAHQPTCGIPSHLMQLERLPADMRAALQRRYAGQPAIPQVSMPSTTNPELRRVLQSVRSAYDTMHRVMQIPNYNKMYAGNTAMLRATMFAMTIAYTMPELWYRYRGDIAAATGTPLKEALTNAVSRTGRTGGKSQVVCAAAVAAILEIPPERTSHHAAGVIFSVKEEQAITLLENMRTILRELGLGHMIQPSEVRKLVIINRHGARVVVQASTAGDGASGLQPECFVIFDEMAYGINLRHMLPSVLHDNRAFVGSSTPAADSRPTAGFFRTAVTGDPTATGIVGVDAARACSACVAEDKATSCTHNLGNIPPWLISSYMRIRAGNYDALGINPDQLLREFFGIDPGGLRPVFGVQTMKLLRAIPTVPRDKLFADGWRLHGLPQFAVDPSVDSSTSRTGMVALLDRRHTRTGVIQTVFIGAEFIDTAGTYTEMMRSMVRLVCTTLRDQAPGFGLVGVPISVHIEKNGTGLVATDIFEAANEAFEGRARQPVAVKATHAPDMPTPGIFTRAEHKQMGAQCLVERAGSELAFLEPMVSTHLDHYGRNDATYCDPSAAGGDRVRQLVLDQLAHLKWDGNKITGKVKMPGEEGPPRRQDDLAICTLLAMYTNMLLRTAVARCR
jgi:hypothetical protein